MTSIELLQVLKHMVDSHCALLAIVEIDQKNELGIERQLEIQKNIVNDILDRLKRIYST